MVPLQLSSTAASAIFNLYAITFFYLFSMKFKSIYSALAVGFTAAIFMGNSTGPGNNGNGDRSGASGTTCNSCHTGSTAGITEIEVQDTFGNVQTSYMPDSLYVIVVRAVMGGPTLATQRFGFNARVRNNSTDVGTITLFPNPNERITNNVVEHRVPLTNAAIRFYWRAPATGVGSIDIYGASLLANMNGGTSVDVNQTPAVLSFPQASTPIAVTEQTANLDNMLLFPTQTQQFVNLRFTTTEAAQFTAQIVSVSGATVSTQVFAAQIGEQVQTIEVQDLPAGTYFVRLHDGKTNFKAMPFIKF